jgi:hypothetical protein
MAECRAHGTAILTVQDRTNQNSGILFSVLQNSLTPEAHAIIDLEPDQYTINGEVEGLCLLKHIFSKSHVDTNTTVGSLRIQVSGLDDKMVEMKNDIVLFHQHVLQLEHALAAHGERCDELLASLFKAYKRIADDEFKQFIHSHEFTWDQPGAVLTARMLMTSVENHYQKRVVAKTWKPRAVKTEKERIIALEAENEQLKAPNQGKANNNDNEIKGKYGWKKIPPKPGKPNRMVWKPNGKTYHWCPKHRQWTIHTPEECTKGSDNSTANSTEETTIRAGNNNTTPKAAEQPTMTIDPALQAIVNFNAHMMA